MKAISAVLLVSLAACSSGTTAPSGSGLCWRATAGAADEQPTFALLARDITNLESCAVQLEALRMMEGQAVAGAYNGHFIFAAEDQITSATNWDGTRVRIFEASDRRKIQDGLRELIAHQRAGSP